MIHQYKLCEDAVIRGNWGKTSLLLTSESKETVEQDEHTGTRSETCIGSRVTGLYTSPQPLERVRVPPKLLVRSTTCIFSRNI